MERARAIHGFKYAYDNTMYHGKRLPIEIICPRHGSFQQEAGSHLLGHGCPTCGGTKRLSSDDFIARAREVHGTKYDYSGTEYNSNEKHVAIVCPAHGVFKQRAGDHLNGHGCSRCGKTQRLTPEEFRERCAIIHRNRYNYAKAQYRGCDKPVKIICPVHGEFEQRAILHLTGRGCAKCSRAISRISQCWLDEIGIPEDAREARIVDPSGRLLIVDGIDRETATVYEFYGDLWHGNPKTTCDTAINTINGKPFGVLYAETLAREKVLRTMGYSVVSIWETDYRKTKKEA